MSLEDIQPNRNKEDYKRMKEQPDSQAGDELKELREFLRGSFEQFLHSDPIATTSAICSIAADRAMINVHRAIDHYAERLAAERAIAELKRPKTYHMDVDSSPDYKQGFKDALEQTEKSDELRIATLTTEAKK